MNTRGHFAIGYANLRWMLAGAVLASLCACGGGDPENAPADNARKELLSASRNTSVVHRATTRDKFAFAAYAESSGCEGLALEVFAGETLAKSDGTSTSSALVRAQLFTVNSCTGAIAFMSGFTETGTMRFRANLARVTVEGTVVMQDEFGATRTVSIQLDWDGGLLTTDKDKTVTVTPVSRTIVRTVGKIRQSETITGALVLDGVDLLAPSRPGSLGISGFVVASAGSTIEITRGTP